MRVGSGGSSPSQGSPIKEQNLRPLVIEPTTPQHYTGFPNMKRGTPVATEHHHPNQEQPGRNRILLEQAKTAGRPVVVPIRVGVSGIHVDAE